jgi:hypothetical protein
MLVAGLLTCTMFYAAFAPQPALRSTFGDVLQGDVANIVVRNWGALIGFVGLGLMYGAFHPSARRVTLAMAVASKIVFIGLVLTYGRQYLGHRAGVAVVVDSAMVLVFLTYLVRHDGARA